MDPEIQREYEEHMKTMIDLLSKQADTTSKLISSLQSGMTSTARASKNSVEATDKQIDATNKVTKAQEAAAAAQKKYDDAMVNFSKAANSSKTALTSFAQAMIDSERSLGKYGTALGAAGQAAFDLGKNFGAVGFAVGGLIKLFTGLASPALKAVDSVAKFRDETSKFVGVLPAGLDGIQKLGSDSRFTGDEIMKISKTMGTFGTNILGLGGSAGQGAEKFMKMAAVTDDVRVKFGKLGVDQDRLLEMQGMYIQMQGVSGKALENRTKTEGQLQKESLAYAKNLIIMSELTGQTAEQMQQEREVVKAEFEEQVKIRQENLQIERLKAEAAKATTAEEKAAKLAAAEQIKKEQDNRTALINRMTDAYSKEVGAQYGRMARTGAFDEFTAGMATLGVNAADLANTVKTSNDMQKDSYKEVDKFTKLQSDMTENLSESLQFMGQEQAKTTGLSAETVKRGNNYIVSTFEEEERKARKKIAEKEASTKETEDELEKTRTAEREVRKVFYDAMYELGKVQLAELANILTRVANGIVDFDKWVRENIDSIKTWSKVVGGVIAALIGLKVIGSVVSLFKVLGGATSGLVTAFKGAFEFLKRLGGMGGKTPIGPTKGADGRWRDARGRFAAAPDTSTVATGGKVLKVAKGLAGGAGSLLGGMALDYGAEKASEAGHTKTAAGLSVGSSAATGAGTGAMIGSVVPVLGTAIGAAIGGAIGGGVGLYKNWGELTGGAKVGEPKKEAEKITDGKSTSGGQSTTDDITSAKMTSSKPNNVKLGENADLSGMNSNILTRFFTAAKEFGQDIKINSAYRGDNYQAQLWVRGRILGEPGIHTPARPKNTTTINYKGKQYTVEGSGKGSKHGRGEALDISTDRAAFDPILERYGLHRPFKQKDPPHVELKAMKGGVFNGPSSGYPVELHGQEIVSPISMDSILMKLAKTPATTPEGEMIEKSITTPSSSAASNNTDAVLKMHSELIEVLSAKLDNMIDILDEGNDTREKIFNHTMV